LLRATNQTIDDLHLLTPTQLHHYDPGLPNPARREIRQWRLAPCLRGSTRFRLSESIAQPVLFAACSRGSRGRGSLDVQPEVLPGLFSGDSDLELVPEDACQASVVLALMSEHQTCKSPFRSLPVFSHHFEPAISVGSALKAGREAAAADAPGNDGRQTLDCAALGDGSLSNVTFRLTADVRQRFLSIVQPDPFTTNCVTGSRKSPTAIATGKTTPKDRSLN